MIYMIIVIFSCISNNQLSFTYFVESCYLQLHFHRKSPEYLRYSELCRDNSHCVILPVSQRYSRIRDSAGHRSLLLFYRYASAVRGIHRPEGSIFPNTESGMKEVSRPVAPKELPRSRSQDIRPPCHCRRRDKEWAMPDPYLCFSFCFPPVILYKS